MDFKELYPFIFKRKSIRKYDLRPIDPALMTKLTSFIQSLQPLYPQIRTEVTIVPPDDVQRRFMRKPGHYVLFFSDPSPGFAENAGFMLQQVDLFLSANGLGSCWQMIPKPHSSARETSSLDYVILLAIGTPSEPLHRASLAEFDRRPLNQVSNAVGLEEFLEPARLAPSGTNNQPWYFAGTKNMIHVYCAKKGRLKSIFVGKMDRISVGIALCHIWLAILNQGKRMEVTKDPDAEANPPPDYYYLLTLQIQ